MRIIFHIRPLRFMFIKNWYGIRKGGIYTYSPEKYAWLLDIGSLTVGYAK